MNQVPHYNAFISYRHHPQDIAVAEAIHKGLERFKVPSSLRKQGKKIERIFRDKEELPITSSLTDTITSALANSDYLIVICSTHLQESYWVLREIDAFLKTHTKDQILTVIVDGEPGDVIPEILTYREVTDPRTGQTVREPLEPLSCDWRLPKRKAMKEELPRLAAVLLGCTYNDLMQRQKQYQMRRMAAGFSVALAVALGFAGYFLYSSIQIQENLDEALRNQSQYLASSSADLFQNGDRLTALALALEALPEAEGERPYVIEAERALSEALLLYNPNSAFIATAAFTADQLVECFALSPDGNILYTQDNHSTVVAWDTDTGSRLGSMQLDRIQPQLHVDNTGNLVVENGSSSTIQCYSPAGKLLWQREDVSSFAITAEGDAILAVHTALSKPITFMMLDPADGSVRFGPATVPANGLNSFSGRLSGTDYYTNALIPMAFSKTENNILYNICAVYDMTTGTITRLLETSNTILPFTTLPDGKLLIAENTTQTDPNDLSDWRQCTATLHCFDSSGKPLWTAPLTGYRVGRVQTIEVLPDSGDILVQYDNSIYVLSSSTGRVISRFVAPNFPLEIVPDTDGATVIFQDGSVVWFDYATGNIYHSSYKLDSDLDTVQVNRGIYISKDLSPTVLRYTSTADDSYTVADDLEEVYLNLYTDDMSATHSHMALIAKDTLRCYDLSAGSLMWTADWPRSTGKLLGLSEDSGKLYAWDEKQVRCYDIADGTETRLDFPVFYRSNYSCILSGDHLYYLDSSRTQEDILYLIDWNLANNTHRELKFANTVERQFAVLHYADENQVIVRTEAGSLYHMSLADGTCRRIAREAPKYPVFLIDSEADQIILSIGGEIRTLDSNLDVLQSVTLPDITPVSLFRHEGRLLVLADDEMVYVYNEEGTLEKRYELAVYENFFNYTELSQSLAVPISWAVTPDGEVFVNVYGAGNILPMDQSMARYYLKNMLHYDPATDTIYCYADNDDRILTYQRLSTAEVIARGHAQLGDFTLTAEQKEQYGLE